MTNSCTGTRNGAPNAAVKVVDEEVMPELKRSGSSESVTTTTVEESEEPALQAMDPEGDDSSESSSLDLDFGVMGVSEGLPQEENPLPFGGTPPTTATITAVEEPGVLPVAGGFILGASESLSQKSSVFTELTTCPAEPGLVTVETVKKQLEAGAEPVEESLSTEEAIANEEPTDKETTSDPEEAPPVKPNKPLTFGDTLRKGAVAVAGGTLTAVGLVMIPLPTPCGALVAGSGMALLGTEFEAANRVMENLHTKAASARDRVISHVEKSIQDDGSPKDTTEDVVISKLPTAAASTACDENNSKDKKDGEAATVEEAAGQESKAVPKGEDLQDSNSPETVVPAKEEETESEFMIAVDTDAYFNKEVQDISDQRKKGGFWQNARQRIGREKKGWLATTVLPMLQSTKSQDSNNVNQSP